MFTPEQRREWAKTPAGKESTRKANARPAARARQKKVLKAWLQTPKGKEYRKRKSQRRYARPEVRERLIYGLPMSVPEEVVTVFRMVTNLKRTAKEKQNER